jgi:hypothetical protein
MLEAFKDLQELTVQLEQQGLLAQPELTEQQVQQDLPELLALQELTLLFQDQLDLAEQPELQVPRVQQDLQGLQALQFLMLTVALQTLFMAEQLRLTLEELFNDSKNSTSKRVGCKLDVF